VNVVIDTNVFVSSILNPVGTPGKVIDLWKRGRVILCLSREILDEYLEVIARFGISDDPAVADLLKIFEGRCNQVYVAHTVALSAAEDDPHDNKFIECAVAAQAQAIISGDRHLLKLKEFQGIRIVTPAAFLREGIDLVTAEISKK
jgi:putative PIN family toxin of toxin-antitoxin system